MRALALLALALTACAAQPSLTDVTTSDAAAESGALDTSVVMDAADASCALVEAAAAGPFAPPHAAQSACTADELGQYFTACLDGAGALPLLCQQFVTGHPGCAQCILPRGGGDAGGAGALLEVPGGTRLDVGGCVALLLGDPSPTGCGAREQAALECVEQACASCEGDPACPARARAGECGATEVARCPELAGAAGCSLDGSYAQRFGRVAAAFCGGR